MNCSLKNAAIFTMCVILYGCSYAVVSIGLQYFTAGLFQAFRMFFGLTFTAIVLSVRCMLSVEYRLLTRNRFLSGWKIYIWLIIDGLLNLGIPHCLIAIAQQWINSASVQMMQPFSPTAGSIFAHFVLKDEKFSKFKVFSIILSMCGVACTAVPSFVNAGENEASVQELALGYVLVIISISMFGIANVWYKWKIPGCDPTFGVFIQLITATVFEVTWTICFDGIDAIHKCFVNSNYVPYLCAFLVGTLVSGLGVQGLAYLVVNLGAFSTNLAPFGQIMVGVLVGVCFLGDWDGYKPWQIALCCVGMVLLSCSLAVGFLDKRSKTPDDIKTEVLNDQANDERDIEGVAQTDAIHGDAQPEEEDDSEVNRLQEL